MSFADRFYHSNFFHRYCQRAAQRRYLHLIGHIAPGVVLLDDGSLLAAARVHGQPHQLATREERRGSVHALNSAWQAIANDTVAIGTNFVKREATSPASNAVFSNDFIAGYAEAYERMVVGAGLFHTSWYVTLLASPHIVGGGRAIGHELVRILRTLTYQEERKQSLGVIEDLWSSVSRNLQGYRVTRLAEREEDDGAVFSEIAEALREILYCKYLKVGQTDDLLGDAIYTERVVFDLGDNIYHALSPTGPDYGQLFGFRTYPQMVLPERMDALLELPFRSVISQSFGFIAPTTATGKAGTRQKQMRAAQDMAVSQIEAIGHSADDVGSGRTERGSHHWSFAHYASDPETLRKNAGEVQRRIADTGASPIVDDLGNEAEWWSQIPGNLPWRNRTGNINSIHYAGMAGLGGNPIGRRQSRWGGPVMRLKTREKTAYDLPTHDRGGEGEGDVGSIAIVGPSTSGKTTFALTYLLHSDPWLGDNGLAFLVDKDRGGEMAILSAEGSYRAIIAGQDTGNAPLLGLPNTPLERAFASRFLAGLALSDGRGPFPAEDYNRLADGLEDTMDLPLELRSIAALRGTLGGFKDSERLGPRLEPWMRGKANGWAFDGRIDDLDLSRRYVGRDLTTLLDHPTILGATAQYYMHRLRAIMDGRRIIYALDESPAYLPYQQFIEDIEALLRDARKLEVVLMLLAQAAEHFTERGGTFGATLLGQCARKVFFRSGTADQETYIGSRRLVSDGAYRTIRERLRPREFVLCSEDDGEMIVDFDLTPVMSHVNLISGRAASVRRAEELRRLNPLGWTNDFMRETVQ